MDWCLELLAIKVGAAVPAVAAADNYSAKAVPALAEQVDPAAVEAEESLEGAEDWAVKL